MEQRLDDCGDTAADVGTNDCEHWVEKRDVGAYLETMTSFGAFIVSRLDALEALTVHLLGDPE